MAKVPTKRTTSPSTPWITQRQIRSLYVDINKYVLEYTSEHQNEMNSNWFEKWYDWFHTAKIGKEETSYSQSSFLITKRPKSTPSDVILALIDMIPHLNEHITIHQVSQNGNIKYHRIPYGFQTPRQTIAPKDHDSATLNASTLTKSSTNHFSSLATDQSNDDDDNGGNGDNNDIINHNINLTDLSVIKHQNCTRSC